MLSAALTSSSLACPSSGDLHGSRWRWWCLPGWQCPGGTASPASASDSKRFLFGGQRRPCGGEGGWWECAKPPAAPCRLWDVSQRLRARCGSCTPTRCLCSTWKSSSSALPVGGCGSPPGGVSPMHPSLKKTLYAAESSSPRQGFEPPSATPQSGGSAGTGVMLLGNGPPWSWQGYFWSRWSSSKEQEQRQEQCWALPQVPHTLPRTVPLQLLHVLPWQSSWDEKQPLCLCAGVQGTEQCEIIQPSLGAALGC